MTNTVGRGLGLAFAVLIGVAAGYLGRGGWPERPKPAPSPTPPPSRVWQKARTRPGEALAERQKVNEEVASLPYLQGYDRAGAGGGVTRHEPGAYEGVNLYNSGHAPEASLIDMAGRPLHRWRLGFRDVFPRADVEEAQKEYTTYWRRVHLLPDGGLLAIYQLQGLVRLDAGSRLVWKRKGGFHHDLTVREDGTIVVLDATRSRLPRINKAEDVLEDFVTVLDLDGNPRDRFSLLEAFERSDYAPLLQNMKPRGDLFHTNAVKVLDGTLSDRLPAFRKGNLLVSLRTLDTVAVVDPGERKVVWALSGLWESQHEPVLLKTGRMLVFDNLGRGGESRIVEFDPASQRVLWRYEGAPNEPFASWKVGVVQRLSNGNTLITESTAGRALEVTPEGKTVWEFLNPARAGEQKELIATLYEMRRLPKEVGTQSWLVPPS